MHPDVRISAGGSTVVALSASEKEWAVALGEDGKLDFPRTVVSLRDLEHQSILELAVAKRDALGES